MVNESFHILTLYHGLTMPRKDCNVDCHDSHSVSEPPAPYAHQHSWQQRAMLGIPAGVACHHWTLAHNAELG